MMGTFIKRNVLLVVGLVAAAIAGVILIVALMNQGANEQENLVQLNELETQLSEAEDQQIDQEREISDELLGVDSARLDTDAQIIDTFLNDALTWSSHEEYMASRDTVKRKYGLGEDSEFMTTFLPKDGISKTNESSGKQYNLIDVLGLDSQVGGYDTSVLSVNGTEYAYFIEVHVRGTSADGEGSHTMPSLVMLTLDDQGNLSEVSASATVSDRRHSAN